MASRKRENGADVETHYVKDDLDIGIAGVLPAAAAAAALSFSSRSLSRSRMLKVGLPIGEATNDCEPSWPLMDCTEDAVSTWTRDDERLCGLELFSLPGVRVPAAPTLALRLVGAGATGAVADTFVARELKKLPIPDPHAPSVARAACAVSAKVGDIIGGGTAAAAAAVGGGGSAGVVDVRRTSPTPRDSGLRPPPSGWGGESVTLLPRLSTTGPVGAGRVEGGRGCGDDAGLGAVFAR